MRPVVADDAGRFDERDLPTGKYSISTECSKDELALVGLPADTSIMETLLQRMLDVGPGADIEIELGTPPKNPIRVSGRVAAEPMPREIMMQWIPEGEDGMDRAKFKRVAQDGTYEVVLAEAGPYNVSMIVASSPRIERTVDVPSGSEFAQDFALAAGTLRGRLRTAAGEPVVRALVELTFRAGHRPVNFMSSIAYTRTTDGEGRFSFDRLDPARYALGIYGGATTAGEKTGALSVRDVVVPNQGASAELDLVAPIGHVIRGRVVDAAGGAVNYASVFVFDANGEPLDPITPAMSDKKGAFTLPPLAPGHYSLVGACGVRWTEPAALDVLEKNTDIELHLRDAATLDVSAESLGESWIDVRDAQGNCLSAVLDRNLFNGTVTRASFRSTWRYLVPAGDLEVRAIDSTGAVVASSKVSAAAGGKQLVKLAR
jgi:hypothetical protein